MSSVFNYQKAFCRNIGIVSSSEQEKIKSTRIGIAGVGGVGGIAALTLARMGYHHFCLADMDTFSVENTNRQFGANTKTYDFEKTKAIANMIQEINPEAQIQIFDQGIQKDSVERFVQSCDLIIDSLDFFCLESREWLHHSARHHGKTIFLSAPMGFSVTLHVFTPQSMSYFDFFGVRPEMTPFQKLGAFAVGLSPSGLHWKYMKVNPESLEKKYGPSICSAVALCAGILGTEILTVTLQKRSTLQTPYYMQMDPFRQKYVKRRLWFGARNPLQVLKRWVMSIKYKDYEERVNKALMSSPSGGKKAA